VKALPRPKWTVDLVLVRSYNEVETSDFIHLVVSLRISRTDWKVSLTKQEDRVALVKA
jgi:hypothetical protein